MTREGGNGAGWEPTNADVLAAIQALAGRLDGLDGKVGSHGEALERLSLNFAAHAELAHSRHTESTQALEAIASMAQAQQHALVQAEARLTSHLEDVQRVVQATKADIAAHASNAGEHPHAA